MCFINYIDLKLFCARQVESFLKVTENDCWSSTSNLQLVHLHVGQAEKLISSCILKAYTCTIADWFLWLPIFLEEVISNQSKQLLIMNNFGAMLYVLLIVTVKF